MLNKLCHVFLLAKNVHEVKKQCVRLGRLSGILRSLPRLQKSCSTSKGTVVYQSTETNRTLKSCART